MDETIAERWETWGRLCIPIVETTVEKALIAIKKASRLADLIELRVDYLKRVSWHLFLRVGRNLLSSPIGEKRKEANTKGRRERGWAFYRKPLIWEEITSTSNWQRRGPFSGV